MQCLIVVFFFFFLCQRLFGLCSSQWRNFRVVVIVLCCHCYMRLAWIHEFWTWNYHHNLNEIAWMAPDRFVGTTFNTSFLLLLSLSLSMWVSRGVCIRILYNLNNSVLYKDVIISHVGSLGWYGIVIPWFVLIFYILKKPGVSERLLPIFHS